MQYKTLKYRHAEDETPFITNSYWLNCLILLYLWVQQGDDAEGSRGGNLGPSEFVAFHHDDILTALIRQVSNIISYLLQGALGMLEAQQSDQSLQGNASALMGPTH